MAKVLCEQGCDSVEAHAPVHRLGRQRVTQLMGGDVANAGRVGDAPQCGRDAVVTDRSVVFD